VAKHNTLTVNDSEQNIWHTKTKDDLFWIIKKRTNAKVNSFNEEHFSGSHFAFGEECTRKLNLKDNIMTGKDICRKSGRKTIRFHFHPEVSISEKNDLIEIKRDDSGIIFRSEAKLTINDYLYSPAYGILQNAKVIVIESDKEEIDWEIEIIS
jgi:uncharacterized heparinase superfamily protein